MLTTVLVYAAGIAVIPRHSYAIHVWADIGWTLVSAAAALRCFVTARRASRPSHRRSFLLFGMGCMSWTVGMLLWDYEELVLGVVTPFPHLADWFFLALWPSFIAGLWIHGSDEANVPLTLKQAADIGVILSTMIILAALTFGGAVETHAHESVFAAAALAYPVTSLSLLVFAILALLYRRWGVSDRRVIAILIAALVMLALVNMLYAYLLLAHAYEAGHELDVLWVATFALVIWAAYEEDWIEGVLAPRAEPRPLSAVDAIVPAGSILSIVGVALVVEPRFDETAVRAILAGCGVLAISLGLRGLAANRLETALRAQLELRERQFVEAQKMQAVATLAGGVAHDFNNVLTCMMAGVEMIKRRGGVAEGAAEHLDLIEQSIVRAGELAKRLVTLSRRREPAVVPLRPSDVLHRVATVLRSAMPSTIEVVVDPGDATSWIAADDGQLEQALLNLGINAGHAMPAGGRLRLSARVERSEAQARSFVVFQVSDSGVGIAPEVRPHVFEPFFTTRSGGGGSGLGLAMVRAAAESHGGSVSVDSEVGRGSTFTMRIPMVRARPPTVPTCPRPEEFPGGHETVLVVDSRVAPLLAVRMVLEAAGYRVLSASTSEDALRLLAEHDDIALALVDGSPEDLGRVEFARTVRASGLPTVLMSDFLDAPDFDAVVEKPFRPTTLATVIRTALDRRESAGA